MRWADIATWTAKHEECAVRTATGQSRVRIAKEMNLAKSTVTWYRTCAKGKARIAELRAQLTQMALQNAANAPLALDWPGQPQQPHRRARTRKPRQTCLAGPGTLQRDHDGAAAVSLQLLLTQVESCPARNTCPLLEHAKHLKIKNT